MAYPPTSGGSIFSASPSKLGVKTPFPSVRRISSRLQNRPPSVSSLGVTGVRGAITTDVGAMVRLVKREKDIPCAVGFGISTPEQAASMASQSDGAIVGSAIVKLCEKYGEECVPHVARYVREMAEAVHGA